jgi:hypothetical protein
LPRRSVPRAVLARFPGLLQLQAGLLDDENPLARAETWTALADSDVKRVETVSKWHDAAVQRKASTWGLPDQALLSSAQAFQTKLRAQARDMTQAHRERFSVVVGRADRTPDGYRSDADSMEYYDAVDAGDGKVTHRSAMLTGVRTWQLDAPHGELINTPSAFPALLQLLETGATSQLRYIDTSELNTRTVQRLPRPPRRAAFGAPPSTQDQVLALPVRVDGPSDLSDTATPALQITVTNGNLKFVSQALLLGHYQAMVMTGSEHVIDVMIGGTMSQLLKLGSYPNGPGSLAVFENVNKNDENPLQLPRPKAAIIVGLGAEGKLTASDLVLTVRAGVVAWAQRTFETRDGTSTLEIAATLIGSGGISMSAGQAARLIAQGVREANELLSDAKWPIVDHLHLIELYLDRATEAWRTLQLQASVSPTFYRLTDHVKAGVGGLTRPLESSYRGASYDFITATHQLENDGRSQAILYRLDTKRARTELTAKQSQQLLVQEMIVAASNENSANRDIGRTLFVLLVPIEMDAFSRGATEMLIELDPETAKIPWELLEPPDGPRRRENELPWSIRAKLLRKLRTTHARANVVDATTEQAVLVIALGGAAVRGIKQRVDEFRRGGFLARGSRRSRLLDDDGRSSGQVEHARAMDEIAGSRTSAPS